MTSIILVWPYLWFFFPSSRIIHWVRAARPKPLMWPRTRTGWARSEGARCSMTLWSSQQHAWPHCHEWLLNFLEQGNSGKWGSCTELTTLEICVATNPQLSWIDWETQGTEEVGTWSCLSILHTVTLLLLFKFVFKDLSQSWDFSLFSYWNGNSLHKCVGHWMLLRRKEQKAYKT